jgi:16S rRNA G1207 methylase RsmC
LAPKGQLWVVTNRFIRYDDLLRPLFRRVDLAAEDEHYRVLIAR